MESSYEIVNTDLVEMKMSITATREQWNGLRLALPTNNAYCSALRGLIETMLNSNKLTVVTE